MTSLIMKQSICCPNLNLPQTVRFANRHPGVRAHAFGQSDRSCPKSSSVNILNYDPSVDAAPNPIHPVLGRTPASTTAFCKSVSHPFVLVPSLAIYTIIVFDVFGPNTQHLLEPSDQAVHKYALLALANIDPDLRHQIFGNVLSNGLAMAGSVGWIFTTATAISRYNPLAWQVCALGWALWIFGVGPIEHDAALMEILKTSFGRPRPSSLRQTPSFPSGHTAAVVFIVGALVFVLLPVVYGIRPDSCNRDGDGCKEATAADGDSSNQGSSASGGNDSVKGPPLILEAIYSVQGSFRLWWLSALTTAVGRIGMDVHWLSDTLAGAALGAVLVAGLANATQRLVKGVKSTDEGKYSDGGHKDDITV